MKKLALSLIMVFLGANIILAYGGDYVVTENGTYFFKSIKYAKNSCLMGQTSLGEKIKFKKCDIKAYSKDGEVFEKMPVYKNNVATGETDFMKVVSFRNGMKLYEYEYTNSVANSVLRRYYVFKGEKLVVEMDNTNRQTIAAFFKAE